MLAIFAKGVEKKLLSLENQGYLREVGWINSVTASQVTDARNNPLPWLTYPFISFITGRLKPGFRVFEYGSGNSTLYYAGKVLEVDALEHDQDWYLKMKEVLPANASLYFCELTSNGTYSHYAAVTGKQYDIIIVDGRDRVNCCKNSIPALAAGGVIVLDDSERNRYSGGVAFLAESGFKSLDFCGLAPVIDYQKCTTIFYRADNCLGI